MLLIVAGAFFGGFVNGLSGFGTTLVALPFWIHAVPPIIAAQIGAGLGIAGQLQAVRAIGRQIRAALVMPYILAGLIGVPVGTTLLPLVDARSFKLGVGAVIVMFCIFQIAGRDRLRVGDFGGRGADAFVGLIGGFLGGLAGMSGPVPTIWASLRGLGKDEKRTLFLAFNLVILIAVLTVSAIQGSLSWAFGRAMLIALPATIIGSRLGVWAYGRLDAARYNHIVLTLLLLSGISLVWGNT